jgi:hypothetical protein
MTNLQKEIFIVLVFSLVSELKQKWADKPSMMSTVSKVTKQQNKSFLKTRVKHCD